MPPLSDRSTTESWWVFESEFHPPLISPGRTFDPEIVFGELGMVCISRSTAEISLSWDVDGASSKSIAATLDYLSGLPEPTPVRLSYHKSGWMDERRYGPQSARARIEQIQQYAGIKLGHRTVIRRLEVDGIERAMPLLNKAWRIWGERHGESDLPGHPLKTKALFFSAARGSDLHFAHLGPQSVFARFVGPSYQDLVGQKANTTLADERYDNRVSAMYAEALNRGAPIYDHVLAQIDVGSRRVWRPYQRLLLPHGDWLACFVESTADLEIRFLGGELV